MALQRQTPSAGGFASTAGQPITKPLITRVDSNGNARKSLGTTYKRNTFRNSGPTGKRGR